MMPGRRMLLFVIMTPGRMIVSSVMITEGKAIRIANAEMIDAKKVARIFNIVTCVV